MFPPADKKVRVALSNCCESVRHRGEVAHAAAHIQEEA
jgi:hypothetical protein